MAFKKSIYKIEFKSLLSHLLFFMIPLISIILIYFTSIKLVLSTQQEKSLATLSQSVSLIETKCDEVFNTLICISENEYVTAILNAQNLNNGDVEMLDIYKLCNSLPNYTLINNIIDEVMIFFHDAQRVVKSPNAFPLNIDTIHSYLDFDHASYEELSNVMLNDLPQGQLITFSSEHPTDTNADIFMIKSLPSTSMATAEASVAIQFDETIIQGMLDNNIDGNHGIVFIRDQHGNIISSSTGSTDQFNLHTLDIQASKDTRYVDIVIESEKYLLCTIYSEQSQWEYISLIKKSHLLDQISFIRTVLLTMMLLSLLIGVVFMISAWIRSQKMFQTIKDLATKTNTIPKNPTSEYSYISSTIRNVTSKMGVLQTRIDSQSTMLRTAVLRNVLYGDFISKKDLDDDILVSGLNLNASFYTVVVIGIVPDKINSQHQNLAYRIAIKEVIANNYNHEYHFFDLDRNCLAIIFLSSNQDEATGVVTFCEETNTTISTTLKLSSIFAMSQECNHISQLHSRFLQAMDTYQYALNQNLNSIVSFLELQNHNDEFYYPIEIEMRLISLVKCGDQSELKKLLHEVYVENFEKRNLSASMTKHLMECMRMTVMRSLKSFSHEKNVDEILCKLDQAVSVLEIFNYAYIANTQLCKYVDEKRQEDDTSIQEHIKEIIAQNYMDSMFNLSTLSNELTLSETVLYKRFKILFGMTFATYLEQIRIHKSCELFNQGVAINQVSISVGYSSDHSFRRAFKRLMKLSPSEYISNTTS